VLQLLTFVSAVIDIVVGRLAGNHNRTRIRG